MRAALEKARLVDDLEEAGVHRGPMLALLIALHQASSPKKRRAVLKTLRVGRDAFPGDKSFSLALRLLGRSD